MTRAGGHLGHGDSGIRELGLEEGGVLLRAQNLRFRLQGSGFRIQDFGFGSA